MVPWCHGAMMTWCHGAMVTWCHGVMVPWCHGDMVTCRVAESWKRWKHVSSHFRILAATFGWLGQRLSQPTNFGSQISLPFNCLLTGWARGPASQMAGTQPNGCDSAKWLWFSQMTRNQPNGCSSAIWMGLSQVAGTQPNGCDSAKKLGISPKTGK